MAAFLVIRRLLSCRTSPLISPLPFHFSPFSSRIINPSPSSSPPNPQTLNPPISLFLLTEWEFSPSQISKIMKTNKHLLKTRSPHTAKEALEFLKQWGFTQHQIHCTILRYPNVLQCKVDTRLKPKFQFFQTLGFTDQQISEVISCCPRVLGKNLENNIIPHISFLENLFGTKKNLIKAVKGCPSLLSESIENRLKPKLDFFEQWGIRGQLLSLLLSSNSNILVKISMEYLRVKMEYARNTMGIVQGTTTFVYAIDALIRNKPETIEQKMKHLQCLGLLEDEVCELVKKNPRLLIYTTNKIQENMDFLTQTAGFKPNVVLSYPILLQFSVKRRLMPRHAIFKAISSEQQSVHSLPTIFRLSEGAFLGKIVECNPKASMLKEIYKSKMDFVDIGTTT